MRTAQTNIDLELGMARNMFGRITPEYGRRIQAVVDNPCEETWDEANGVIVGSDGWMTLWQAVCECDSSYANIGLSYNVDKVKMPKWAKIPDRALLVKALEFATH